MDPENEFNCIPVPAPPTPIESSYTAIVRRGGGRGKVIGLVALAAVLAFAVSAMLYTALTNNAGSAASTAAEVAPATETSAEPAAAAPSRDDDMPEACRGPDAGRYSWYCGEFLSLLRQAESDHARIDVLEEKVRNLAFLIIGLAVAFLLGFGLLFLRTGKRTAAG